MNANFDMLCTRRLARGKSLQLRDAVGCTVMCCAGTVWITQQNDARDIFLTAGQSFTFDRPGMALIYAVEGIQDEWMGDSGITAINLPLRLVRNM
jgi:hypothetical protein